MARSNVRRQFRSAKAVGFLSVLVVKVSFVRVERGDEVVFVELERVDPQPTHLMAGHRAGSDVGRAFREPMHQQEFDSHVVSHQIGSVDALEQVRRRLRDEFHGRIGPLQVRVVGVRLPSHGDLGAPHEPRVRASVAREDGEGLV